MTVAQDLLVDAFERIRDSVNDVVGGLSAEQLAYRVDQDANSIAWLVWHLARVQDDHIAAAAGADQVWLAAGWAERFGFDADDAATGFGHTSADVSAVTATPDLLAGYHEAVHGRTVEYLRALTDDDMSEVVDDRWDPPVTLAVRLVSIINDGTQHVGQAAYIRGILERMEVA